MIVLPGEEWSQVQGGSVRTGSEAQCQVLIQKTQFWIHIPGFKRTDCQALHTRHFQPRLQNHQVCLISKRLIMFFRGFMDSCNGNLN